MHIPNLRLDVTAYLLLCHDFRSLEEYCREYVETMGVDAEGAIVSGGLLLTSLQCSGCTVFLDPREEVNVTVVHTQFRPPGSVQGGGRKARELATLHLLLRPGHYDLLYLRPDIVDQALKMKCTVGDVVSSLISEGNVAMEGSTEESERNPTNQTTNPSGDEVTVASGKAEAVLPRVTQASVTVYSAEGLRSSSDGPSISVSMSVDTGASSVTEAKSNGSTEQETEHSRRTSVSSDKSHAEAKRKNRISSWSSIWWPLALCWQSSEKAPPKR